MLLLRDHLDGMAGALLEARAAASAFAAVNAVAQPWSQLGDCLLGAGGVAVVAFKAVAAGQTALRFVPRLYFVQSLHHFVETRYRTVLLHGWIDIAEHRQVKHVEAHQ